jgi:hypothetical protein
MKAGLKLSMERMVRSTPLIPIPSEGISRFLIIAILILFFMRYSSTIITPISSILLKK